MDFPIRFDHKDLEGKIYKIWEEGGYFRADVSSGKEPFVIVIPPPNITGSLHIGHALNNTLQDILIRWKRMQGFEALYLPGTDHAGIATQFVVEKELMKEGKTRSELGREGFLEKVWQWKKKYGETILHQLRRLGCSCDWSRTRFTMDEGYSRAIKYVFVYLYKRGFIYKGFYIVNWCPRCLTALSDIEVVHTEEDGKLWYVKYPIKDSSDFISVATTRPETILGDTAVAVNPNDTRFAKFIGKIAILPIIERELPIIADEFVDPAFGTGAVKITPAHDLNDFEASQRHKLPAVFVIDEKGIMNENAGPFGGLDRFTARYKVLEKFKDLGLYIKEEDYKVSLGRCYRCNTIIEPYLSEQWFVKMKSLAQPAIEAVENGDTKFIPERWAKIYLEWLYNIKDWCISRQIWWGHRIPAWYCIKCNAGKIPASSVGVGCGETLPQVRMEPLEMEVGRPIQNAIPIVDFEPPNACPKCGNVNLVQDPDVLDTWFSSALWPFATLGWPEYTDDLEKFYPTSVLVTDRGIIHLWVARMVMTGLEFCGEKPFSEVFINPTVVNPEGKRMSKSLGTGIDPIELIDEYGADAVRFALTGQVTQIQDIKFSISRIEESRNFVTKIWNSARFVYTNAKDVEPKIPVDSELAIEDKWILSRLNSTISDCNRYLETYEFGKVSDILFRFVWGEFCDWYIELAKRRLSVRATKEVLLFVMDKILRILHPFIPFVTEEIWGRFKNKEVLIKAEWPQPHEEFILEEIENKMQLAIDIVRGIRELRHRINIKRQQPVQAVISLEEQRLNDIISSTTEIIKFLGNCPELEIGLCIPRPKRSLTFIGGNFSVYLLVGRGIDILAELDRQKSKLKKIQEEGLGLENLLKDSDFLKNAPLDVIEAKREKMQTVKTQLNSLQVVIGDMERLSKESKNPGI